MAATEISDVGVRPAPPNSATQTARRRTHVAREEEFGRVVVGVDDSPGGHAALRYAADEAARRGAELHVICVWAFPGAHTAHATVPGPLRDAVVEEAHDVLDRLATEVLGNDPDCATVLVVGEPPPARALIEANRAADVVVVGSRGLGGFAGLLSCAAEDTKPPASVWARFPSQPVMRHSLCRSKQPHQQRSWQTCPVS